MKKYMSFIFCFFVIFLCMESNAYANIAPLKVMPDGVEPLENPGLMIESADVTVTPDNNTFKFNCSYVLKGTQDSESVMLGIPGDPGYTLEAGYIENLKVYVDKSPVEYKILNTTKELSDSIKKYNSQLNFKWHTFQVPVKKDGKINIDVSYNISWRILEQDKSYPYNIVPFVLSTDKFFGDTIGSYKIKYINDDPLSLPDVKVMINSILEPNIISQAILSPTLNDTEIQWEFKSVKDFQDFRLIALSFRRLAMEFTTGTNTDHTIRWAMLNNNYEELATTFESIAKGKIGVNLTREQLGTAAYLSSEFYSRINKYDKARDVLSLSSKSNLWLIPVKDTYLHAMELRDSEDYKSLLDEYKKLSQYKDYPLVSNWAEKEIAPLTEVIKSRDEEAAAQNRTQQEHTNNMLHYLTASIIALVVLLLILLYLVLRNVMKRK